jgi:hypothetical protein
MRHASLVSLQMLEHVDVSPQVLNVVEALGPKDSILVV